MALEKFKEKIDSASPGRAGFGSEGGRGEMVLISTEMVTAEDEKLLLIDLLGTVRSNGDKLYRALPKAHPRYPWLFASAVDLQGFGHEDEFGVQSGTELTEEALEAEPLADEHYGYVRTQARVTFTPRPYALLSDSAIEPQDLAYYDDDGEVVFDTDSGEYQRFLDVEIDDNPQIISMQQGQMWYHTSDSQKPGATSPTTKPYSFPGHPWMVLPDGSVRFIWYTVPYSLFTDREHPMWVNKGKINQQEFLGFPAGSLLYMGPKVRRYSPPVPRYSEETEGAYEAEKWCDISFQCMHTYREAYNPVDPINENHVNTGWNALPWGFSRKFYYATSSEEEATSLSDKFDVPLFKSFPFELLFKVT